jgi:uncharacterized oligopeptide transporter (OPT) family protein
VISFVMFLGGLQRSGVAQRRPAIERALYMTPLASGLIAGEAIIAVIIPLLVVLGLLRL